MVIHVRTASLAVLLSGMVAMVAGAFVLGLVAPQGAEAADSRVKLVTLAWQSQLPCSVAYDKGVAPYEVIDLSGATYATGKTYECVTTLKVLR